jgi:hypothetical protein
MPTVVVTWFNYRMKRTDTIERDIADLADLSALESLKDTVEGQLGTVLRIDSKDGRRLYKSIAEVTDFK